MLCDRILGNVFGDDGGRFAGRRRDPVPLAWRDCYRRAVRSVSAGGVSVGIVLPLGSEIRHGDVLFDDDAVVGVADVTPCDVLVGHFADAPLLARAALELGNFHVPVEVTGFLLATLPGGPAVGVFERYARKHHSEVRRFSPLRATVLAAGLELSAGFRVRRTSTDEQARVKPVMRALE